MTAKRFFHFALVLSLGLALAACERQKIGEITADPGRFMDKDVNVAGRVVQSIGVLGKGIYQIDDGTGKLWVWSDKRGVPSKGAMVGVRGRVTPTVTFMGINYATVMKESSRKLAE
ncbi:MAG: hypothetical protein HY646_00845 [Acidobacteria bacterium]|nr:hypothetical protein [Acidobacteriota bacterium]